MEPEKVAKSKGYQATKGESIKNLVSRFSVSRKTIEKIRDGKTWK